VYDAAGRVTEYVGTIMDVTERKEEEAARRDLQRHLIVAQEDERRRISRELHDEFGQQLSTLTLKLGVLKREHGSGGTLGEQLAGLERIVAQLDANVDLIALQLRPTTLDDLGLVAALAQLVQRWAQDVGIRAELRVSGIEPADLTSEMGTALYRIAQEALNNVAKHAGARRVNVLLAALSNQVSLIVEDDGAGFDAMRAAGGDARQLGIIGMRERAWLLGGTLDIESRPGGGTTVRSRLPTAPFPQPGDDA
jgi:signal transduction histidine kinase